jgi:hypothetical protein
MGIAVSSYSIIVNSPALTAYCADRKPRQGFHLRDLEQEFRAFVGNLPLRDGLSRNREDLHALFQEFMEWRNRQGGKPR